MSIKRWVVIAVLLGAFLLLYAPSQSVGFIQDVKNSTTVFLTEVGLRPEQ